LRENPGAEYLKLYIGIVSTCHTERKNAKGEVGKEAIMLIDGEANSNNSKRVVFYYCYVSMLQGF
jgi:hypothetical protein